MAVALIASNVRNNASPATTTVSIEISAKREVDGSSTRFGDGGWLGPAELDLVTS